jgi:hypothetical protein
MPNQRSFTYAQLVHELIYQADKVLYGVGFAFFTGFTKAPEIKRIGAVVLAKIGHSFLPKTPGTQPSMQQDNWAAPSIYFVMNNALVSSD